MSGSRWLRAGLDTCSSPSLRVMCPGAFSALVRLMAQSANRQLDIRLCTSFRAAAAASLILLSACASKPAIEVRTVRVEVPVPVACIAAADVPVRPGPLPPRPEDARQALDLAVAKVLEWVGYGEKADAVLRVCAE